MSGKVHVTVAEGRNLMKCEPYCIVSLNPSGSGVKEAKTDASDTTQFPNWQRKFSFALPAKYTEVELIVTVMDAEKIKKDVFLGKINIPLSSCKEKEELAQWYPIINKEDPKKGKGEIFLRILVDSQDSAPITDPLDIAKAKKEQVVDLLEETQARLQEIQADNSELVERINQLFADMYYTYCNPKKMGQLEVQVISGRELPAKDILGDSENFFKSTSDPYCKITCGGKLVTTTTKKSTVNPDWGETFTLPVMHAGEELIIDLFDKDLIGKDEFLGQVKVLVADIIRLSPPKLEQTYPLRPKKFMSAKKAGKVKGTLKIALAFTRLEEEQKARTDTPPKLKRKEDLLEMAEKTRDNLLARIAQSNEESDKARELLQDVEQLFSKEYFVWCDPQKVGEVTIKVLEATGLAKRDVIGSSDPFVVLRLENNKQQTPVIKNNVNPKWDNQIFTMGVTSLGGSLHAVVYDHDLVGAPSHLGTVTIPLSQISTAENGVLDQWYALQQQQGAYIEKDKPVTGKLHLEITYKPVAQSESKAQQLVGKDAILDMVLKVKESLLANIRSRDEQLEKDKVFQEEVAKTFLKEYYELCVSEPIAVTGNEGIVKMVRETKEALIKQTKEREAALSACKVALETVNTSVVTLYNNICNPPIVGVLNINVVEARGLAKCDVFGSSDPYVVVQVDAHKDQTPVIHNNLNPKWDKSFSFGVTHTTGTVEFLVWDFDKVGASDFMGAVYISVEDVVKVGQIDQWLTLIARKGITKKESDTISGDIHIVVKYEEAQAEDVKKNENVALSTSVQEMMVAIQAAIKKREEQAAKQIREYNEFVAEIDRLFAKDFYSYCKPQKIATVAVHVIEARGLVAKDIIGTSDPYVIVELEGKEQKTDIIKNNLNPKWNNSKFSFELTRLSANLNFTLYDWDATGSDDFLGYISLPITGGADTVSVVNGTSGGIKPLNVWLSVGHRSSDPSDVTGELHIAVEFIQAQEAEDVKQEIRGIDATLQMVTDVREAYGQRIVSLQEEANKAKQFVQVVDGIFTPAYYQWCKPPAIANIQIQILEGKELIKQDVFGSSDPFVTVELEFQKSTTNVIKNNLNPKWENQVFTLPITKLTSVLKLNVQDWDAAGSNDPMGGVNLRIYDIIKETLEGQKPWDTWLTLLWDDATMGKSKQPIQGAVHVLIEFKPIKIEELKRDEIEYQQEVEGRARSVKEELEKRALEAGTILGKILTRVEKERPLALLPKTEGVINLSINSARGLLAADILTGSSDPYCVVQLGKFEEKTKIVKNSLTPEWNAQFTVPVISQARDVLTITVYDHDLIGSDEFLGMVQMPVALLVHDENEPTSISEGWFKLQPYKKYQAKGEIFLQIKYSNKKGGKESFLLIDFESEAPSTLSQPELSAVTGQEVLTALEEILVGYQERVKALEDAVGLERADKLRVAKKAVSLSDKITQLVFKK